MSTLTVSKKELKKVVTDGVREAIGSELMRLRLLGLAAVSEKEQREIEKSLRHSDLAIGKKVSITA
ncbi:MAG: hypothetical protein AAB468_00405 [Patescibacteria group bacterium]